MRRAREVEVSVSVEVSGLDRVCARDDADRVLHEELAARVRIRRVHAATAFARVARARVSVVAAAAPARVRRARVRRGVCRVPWCFACIGWRHGGIENRVAIDLRPRVRARATGQDEHHAE